MKTTVKVIMTVSEIKSRGKIDLKYETANLVDMEGDWDSICGALRICDLMLDGKKVATLVKGTIPGIPHCIIYPYWVNNEEEQRYIHWMACRFGNKMGLTEKTFGKFSNYEMEDLFLGEEKKHWTIFTLESHPHEHHVVMKVPYSPESVKKAKAKYPNINYFLNEDK